jgi:Ala-tRNA(Pro) deacylase
MESERLLKEFLKNAYISFEEVEHPPLFSCDDWAKYGLPKLPGVDTKNLFLVDENSQFYLLTTECRKRVKLNDLRKHLGLKRLSFAGEHDMLRLLNVTPGSVTSFALLFDKDKQIKFLIDEQVYSSEFIQLHPCRNDRTLIVKRDDFLRFFEILDIAMTKVIIT